MQVIWIVLSFLVGAIPCGLIIAQKFCGIDPRTAGSYNVGSTNVARLCGKKWGARTLICDLLKGFVPVLIGQAFGDGAVYLSLVALAAILGHVYSPFLNFKGGKAVATTIGAFMALAFWPLFFAVIVCLICIKMSGFVSLGSLALVVSLPIFLLFGGYCSFIPLSLVVLALVVWTHRTNIQRLLSGTEKAWSKSACQE